RRSGSAGATAGRAASRELPATRAGGPGCTRRGLMRPPCRTSAAASPSPGARLTFRTSCQRGARRHACSQSIRSPPPPGRAGETSATMSTRSFAFTPWSPQRPWAALVQVLADPDLRHHERPEPIGVRAGSREVLGLEALDLRRLEEATRPHLLRREE